MSQRLACVALVITVTCQWQPALAAQQPVTPQTPIATARPPARASCRDCEELAGRVNGQRQEIDRARARRNAAEEATEFAIASYNRLRLAIVDAAPGSTERARLEKDREYWGREVTRRQQAVEDAAESITEHVDEEARLTRELEECNARCAYPKVTKDRPFLAQPKVYGAVIGGVIGTALLVSGGGGETVATAPVVPSTTAITPTTTVPPVTTPVVTLPPTTSPPPTTPAPTQPLPPIDFSLLVTGTGVDHVSPGNFSDLCSRFTSTPAQPNAPFTVNTTGPGVLQPSVTGTTNNSGVGTFRVRINATGPYNFRVIIVMNGFTATTQGDFNVTGAGVACQPQ